MGTELLSIVGRNAGVGKGMLTYATGLPKGFLV